ncbi:transporter substrate-binding domain-containing protein [Dasania sp. GY-MA-18]|uniref:Transporter substrate-binding domain-containing protein n=1 Tax=Dasania phycosphaerae TaxID=2950436 RepID=A0A9J6RH27_9GAMM|nr:MULTISPECIES: transporter substrate-binding domain-containing protein [Dasania]MCR8921336.1 transporter substrate-binding domain-containing protein [Dasania sp. GY-MA-18]MCZ0863764.1 transporter substrate-binding domain-containing protein [Dasania phycosphaerae]MCZ0867492.1 transporter substrate-binding domain-containing protein [Dasania phycosphaerae]
MPAPQPSNRLSIGRLMVGIFVLNFFTAYSPYSQAEIVLGNITQITVSCDNWPGTCNRDGSGLYFEILRAIYEPEGIHIKHRIDPFMRGLKLVEEQQVDVMAAAYKIPEREQRFTFPKTRLITEYTSVLYKSTQQVPSEGKLKGRINIIRGYDYSAYIDTSAKINEIGSIDQGIKMVLSGRSDYFINAFYDSYAALQRLSKTEGELVPNKVSLKILDSKPIYLVFPNSAHGQNLARLYDKNIQRLFNSGALKDFFISRPIGSYYYYFPELSNDHSLPQFEGH